MHTVVPFRAWRYDTRLAGDLERLIAPPYDVIGPELQSRLYARSRYNVVRIDLGMTTPSDNECDNQYTRAAFQLADWKETGVLARDPEPTLTFVEETFTGPDGRRSTRRGFLALVRLHDFADGVVLPHEQTLSGPKEDRFRLMVSTRMSLSPVFLLYDLPGDEITAAWQAGPGAGEPYAAVIDPDAGSEATVTRLWRTRDERLLELVRQMLQESTFIIADGHHRYETALRYEKYRDESAAQAGLETPAPACEEEPAIPAYRYALAYFSNMADPGLAIYGTHRLISGVDPALVAALPRKLAGAFAVERLTTEGAAVTAQVAAEAIATYLQTNPRKAFGLWGPSLEGAWGLRLARPDAVDAAVPDHSQAYRDLDVTILQSLVLEQGLGITAGDMVAQRHVTFFKEPNDAFERLGRGEFQAGFFMNPTGLDQIRQVAQAGERMPQKATFFYPKLPTGLVFHDLSGGL